MKVLLVEPPRRMWDVMGDCVSPPLGLAQLAAVLEEASAAQLPVLPVGSPATATMV